MPLIPLSSVINLFNAVVSASCALIIWVRRRSMLWQDVFVSRFFFVFIFSTLQFFTVSLPGILTQDTTAIQVIYTLGDVFVMLETFYLVSIPLKIFSKEKVSLKEPAAIGILFTLFYLFYNLIFLKPAIPTTFGSFIDWRGSTNPILEMLVWGLSAIALLAVILLFVINGWFHKQPIVRKRSRRFAVGFSLTFTGWFVVFLFTSFGSTNLKFLVSGGAIGSLLVSLGLLSVLTGIFAREKTNSFLT